MIAFWILAAIMIATALWFIVPPFFRANNSSGYSHDELNVALYKERLQELRTELDEGAMNRAQFEQAQQELERELVEDLSSCRQATESGGIWRGHWGATLASAVVAVVAIALYLQLGTPPSTQTDIAVAQQDASAQIQQIDAMVAGLAHRLEQDPANPEGWVMLGRSYKVLQRYADASRAYARAHELIGDEPWLLADYAEAKAYAQGGDMTGRPAELTLKALERDPENQKALWLAGILAIQQGNGALAEARLRRLLELLPAEGEVAQQVHMLIARINHQGEAPVEETLETPSAPTALTPSPSLTVQVSLAAELKDQVTPTDPVFIYARAPEGPRLPLAVLRRQVKDLPITVVLDDSMAMVPEMPLSRFAEVLVVAQVSKSGNAMAHSGDLRGSSPPVAVGDQVAVTIDEIIP